MVEAMPALALPTLLLARNQPFSRLCPSRRISWPRPMSRQWVAPSQPWRVSFSVRHTSQYAVVFRSSCYPSGASGLSFLSWTCQRECSHDLAMLKTLIICSLSMSDSCLCVHHAPTISSLLLDYRNRNISYFAAKKVSDISKSCDSSLIFTFLCGSAGFEICTAVFDIDDIISLLVNARLRSSRTHVMSASGWDMLRSGTAAPPGPTPALRPRLVAKSANAVKPAAVSLRANGGASGPDAKQVWNRNRGT